MKNKKILVCILIFTMILGNTAHAGILENLPIIGGLFKKKEVKQEIVEDNSKYDELYSQMQEILNKNNELSKQLQEQKDEMSKITQENKDLQNELKYQLENVDKKENEDIKVDNTKKEVATKEDIEKAKESKEEMKYLNNYQLKYDNIKGKRITREALKSYIEAQVNLLFAYNNDLDLIDIDTIDEVPEAKSYILNKNELNTYVIELSDKEPKIDYKRIPDELFKFADGNHKTSLNHIIRLIEKYPEYTYKHNSTTFNTRRKIKEQIITSMVTSQDRAQKEDSDLPWTMRFRNDGQTIDIDYKQFSSLTDEEKEFDFDFAE